MVDIIFIVEYKLYIIHPQLIKKTSILFKLKPCIHRLRLLHSYLKMNYLNNNYIRFK